MWNIYRVEYDSENDYDNGREDCRYRVATTDTEEHAKEIANLLDDYETAECELMGRSDYEEYNGYIIFEIKEE